MAVCSPEADCSTQSEKVIAFYKRARLDSAFQSRFLHFLFLFIFQHKPCESVHDESFTLRSLSNFQLLQKNALLSSFNLV